MKTYEAAADKATKKIRKYGGQVVVRSRATADPVTGMSGQDVVTGRGKALMTGVRASLVDGVTIKSTDKQLMVEASVSVATGQTISFGGINYSVIRDEKLCPDGETLILTEVVVRR